MSDFLGFYLFMYFFINVTERELIFQENKAVEIEQIIIIIILKKRFSSFQQENTHMCQIFSIRFRDYC